MAFLSEPFSLDEVPEPSSDFNPIPAGAYQVQVVSVEPRTTKAGTGEYLACRLDVIGPTHQGRVLWSNINFRNPNPTAQQIGQQQLGELMRANGIGLLEDTDQLIGGLLMAKVSISNDAQYGQRNEVKQIKANAEERPAPAKQPPKAAAEPAAATSAAAKPPWAK